MIESSTRVKDQASLAPASGSMSVARSRGGLPRNVCRSGLIDRVFLYRPTIGDVSRGADIAIGHAPDFAIFVHIDDPDHVIIPMARLNEIGDAFSRWPDPSRAAHNDAHQRRVELKHAQAATNGVPDSAAARIGAKNCLGTHVRCDSTFDCELLPNLWTMADVPI